MLNGISGVQNSGWRTSAPDYKARRNTIAKAELSKNHSLFSSLTFKNVCTFVYLYIYIDMYINIYIHIYKGLMYTTNRITVHNGPCI